MRGKIKEVLRARQCPRWGRGTFTKMRVGTKSTGRISGLSLVTPDKSQTMVATKHVTLEHSWKAVGLNVPKRTLSFDSPLIKLCDKTM